MYEAGFLNKRVTLYNVGRHKRSDFGMIEGDYTPVGVVWANVQFNKGSNAMREGAVDAYSNVMFRMRYNALVTSDTHFEYEGKMYQQSTPPIILKEEDEIQVVCTLMQQ